jgi:putative transposase
MAVVVAYGVRADGVREVLGVDVTTGEHVVFWRTFLQSLVARGMRGVRLVISDAHPGLRQAIREVFVGAAWQRCRVHFMRNVLARVPKTAQAMVAATVRTIFEQPDRQHAQAQLDTVIAALQDRFPSVVELLIEAEDEVFTFYDFPREHRRQIYSTNPLERLNKELKRRSAVVGIFPNRPAVVRLLGAVLVEQHEEWLVGRRYFSETSMRRLLDPADDPAIPQMEAPAA